MSQGRKSGLQRDTQDFTDDEIARRLEAALHGAREVGHEPMKDIPPKRAKPHADMKLGKSKAKTESKWRPPRTSWIDGYIEIDATRTPLRAKGVVICARTQAEAEERRQARLQKSGLANKRGFHFLPESPDPRSELEA